MACKQAYQLVQRQLVLGTPSAVPIVSALYGVLCIVLSTSHCIDGLVLLLLDPLNDGKLSRSSVSLCPRDRPWWLSQDLNLGKVLGLAPTMSSTALRQHFLKKVGLPDRVQVFNSSTQKADVGGSLSSKPTCSTELSSRTARSTRRHPVLGVKR